MTELEGLALRRVEEFTLAVPISALSPDPMMLARHRDWLSPAFIDAEAAHFWLVFQSFIIETADAIIVVDPCNGNGRERPVFPQFHKLDTAYLERFEAAGVRPEDVGYVFCTHLHCDHCGWNTQLRGGRWVPTFPNARYVMVRREVERWDPARPGHHPVDYNVGVFEECVAPIIDAGLAELVADRHAVRPGISIEPAYGHTDGHSILRLESGDTVLYFTGDAFHHPLQITAPELHLGGCDNLTNAIATRRALRSRLFDERALMVPAHFPSPHAGYVSRSDDEYRFAPLEIWPD